MRMNDTQIMMSMINFGEEIRKLVEEGNLKKYSVSMIDDNEFVIGRTIKNNERLRIQFIKRDSKQYYGIEGEIFKIEITKLSNEEVYMDSIDIVVGSCSIPGEIIEIESRFCLLKSRDDVLIDYINKLMELVKIKEKRDNEENVFVTINDLFEQINE